MQAVLSLPVHQPVCRERKVRTTQSTVLPNGKVPPWAGTASATEKIPPRPEGRGKGEKAR